MIINSTHLSSRKSQHNMVPLVLHLESYRDESKVLAKLHFFQEGLEMNPFSSSSRCWQNWVQCFYRTEVPVPLLPVGQGSFSASGDHPSLALWPSPPSSKPATAGQVLSPFRPCRPPFASLSHYISPTSQLFCPLLLLRAHGSTLDPAGHP